MTKTNEERLVAGEVLQGDDALAVLVETGAALQQVWVKIALAYLKQGCPEQAQRVLEELVASGAMASGPMANGPEGEQT